MKKTAAVLACAGSGNRMRGACGDKLLFDHSGIPVVVHALRAYDQTPEIDLLVVVTRAELIEVYRGFQEKFGIRKEMIFVEGRATRMESVYRGVCAVPDDYDFVAIGDGARPLISAEEIGTTVRAAFESGAAALGVHMTDTVKEVKGGKIIRTIPRETLVGIQTPQVFARAEYLILAARAMESGEIFTDDASIYEYFGKEVTFVEGKRNNIKITLPEDIPMFLALMEDKE